MFKQTLINETTYFLLLTTKTTAKTIYFINHNTETHNTTTNQYPSIVVLDFLFDLSFDFRA